LKRKDIEVQVAALGGQGQNSRVRAWEGWERCEDFHDTLTRLQEDARNRYAYQRQSERDGGGGRKGLRKMKRRPKEVSESHQFKRKKGA